MKPLPLPCGAVLRPILIAALGFYTCGASMAYESNYEPTPVGAVEVKDLPPAKVLEAEDGDDYFEVSSGLFRKLFRYLQAHELGKSGLLTTEAQRGRDRKFNNEEARRVR